MEKISYHLEVFDGPLDLLLSLISKNKINIYDIPVSEVLSQYMEHIESMKKMDLEVTSDFLSMASQLLFIKSQMLLPRYEEEEEDPRENLVKMLLEYQRYKAVAESMSSLFKEGSGRFVKEPDTIEFDDTYMHRHSTDELYNAYLAVLKRVKRRLPPPVTSFTGIVGHTIVSVSTKVINILRSLLRKRSLSYNNLFSTSKSRSEVVATFLAVLELAKNKRVNIKDEENGDVCIYLTKAGETNGYKET